ncbi:MAG: radical SAM family heme chaperone HemW [Muribaculaceae bacterium]|nr:radical SAM family heme chaperone HemW [Muribaculaceae bacterium]
MRGYYLHVPFCRHKCLYCDFFTAGHRLADWDSFTRAAIGEMAARLPIFNEESDRASAGKESTIYFGGGSPSLLPPEHFRALADCFLNAARSELREFTVEVNPEDVTEESAALWKSAGATRISMGIQSLVDSELKSIGRRHTADRALRAFEILRKEFSNISVDLIFGLPGQTEKTLSQTLEGFISLRPEHVSAYSLMYEERTALTALRDSGRIEPVEETSSLRMFEMISGKLAEEGYQQYELSNYSLPGKESIHNSSYWKRTPYLGIGPSAHSYNGTNRRRANRPDLFAYLRQGWSPEMVEEEILDSDQLREEMIMTGLRMREGIDLVEFEIKFGKRAMETLIKEATPFMSDKFPEGPAAMLAEGHLSLTRRGIMIADEIIAALF